LIPYVEASGSPWEIGHTVGNKFSSMLQVVSEEFRQRIDRTVEWKRASDLSASCLHFAEHYLPECVQEIRGMSEGSGVDFETLFSINAHQEIEAMSKGCTSLAISKEGTSDNSVLLAHNEDLSPELTDRTYIVKGEPKNEPSYIAFTCGAYILHQGFNDAGIAQVGNALYANDLRPGTPKLLAYREVMRARRLEEAIRKCICPERANGNNHILANREGEVYDVEVSGSRYRLLYSSDGFIAHTNHFTHPEMRDLETNSRIFNSILRLNRTNRLLRQNYGRIEEKHLKQILSDHSNYPNSVCRHTEKEVIETVATVGCVIINLTNQRLLAAQGNPCKSDFKEFRL